MKRFQDLDENQKSLIVNIIEKAYVKKYQYGTVPEIIRSPQYQDIRYAAVQAAILYSCIFQTVLGMETAVRNANEMNHYIKYNIHTIHKPAVGEDFKVPTMGQALTDPESIRELNRQLMKREGYEPGELIVRETIVVHRILNDIGMGALDSRQIGFAAMGMLEILKEYTKTGSTRDMDFLLRSTEEAAAKIGISTI